MRQLVYIYTMFISNNCASFPFWRKENLVKHQKVLKYYENYYRHLRQKVALLNSKMDYFIFYPCRGMDEEIFKNKYPLEKMIVWLINLLKSNPGWFDLQEKMIPKTYFQSPPPPKKKNVNHANLPPGKTYLEIEPLEKIIIKGLPGFLRPYSCMDKKWNSQIQGDILSIMEEEIGCKGKPDI